MHGYTRTRTQTNLCAHKQAHTQMHAQAHTHTHAHARLQSAERAKRDDVVKHAESVRLSVSEHTPSDRERLFLEVQKEVWVYVCV